MANITVFIDETGNFSFKSKTSYIGGWICKSDDIKNIKEIIKGSVRYFNHYLKDEQINSFTLNYPSHMHFMPLHVYDQREKDKSITINPRHVPVFFNHLFNSINEISSQVFRSTGKPAIMPNEQATYIEILRNTLLQLLDKSLESLNNLKVDIIIAHRRVPKLYGADGMDDTHSYEKHIIEGLTTELLNAFENNKPQIKISFEDARNNPGLIMADFFCGAQRWKKNNYLEDYQHVEKYPFSNGYKRIGSRMVQHIRYLQEIDAPSAAMQCADILSAAPESNEIKALLISVIEKMDTSEKSFFCKTIIELFDERLVNDPDRYSHLHSMNELLNILLSIFSTDYAHMPQIELKLIATLFRNQIRIDSHLGKTNSKSIKQFLSFLDKYGENTFNNQMDIMQQRIDAVLNSVQISAFNTFKFDDVEEMLKEIKDKYYKMFDFDPENNSVKDNNLARIEGTLGQMYGFQYDIEQDNDYFEMAEISLKTDISACIENTPSWEQANGYLTTLYWKKGNLEKAIEQFLKESGAVVDDKEYIFNLSDIKTFPTHNKPFIQLHRLYLCALATKNGLKISGLAKEKKFLLSQSDIHEYPRLLSAKWLAIIFILNNDFESAIELLNNALEQNSSDITINAIRISLKLLQHFTSLKLGRNSNFSCENEIKELSSQQKEFGDVLIKRGVEKYYQNEPEWSVYEIGTLLPFYFS